MVTLDRGHFLVAVLHPTLNSHGYRYPTLRGKLTFSHLGLCTLGQHEALHQGHRLATAHFIPKIIGAGSPLDSKVVHVGLLTTREQSQEVPPVAIIWSHPSTSLNK